MKTQFFSLLTLSLLLLFQSCKEDEKPTLGDPPSAEDAAFTYVPSSANPNIIEFTASNSSLTAKWDFGNGTKGEGTNVTGSYPNKGTYTVTLTVFNSGGSNSSSQDIVIDKDDQTLLNNPLYVLLTGGVNGKGFKKWVVDSTRAVHFGVGPNPNGDAGDWPEHWQAPRLAKSTSGLYNDEYVFKISGFGFDHITNGLVFINDTEKDEFPNSYPNADDYSAPFPNQLDETWTLTEGSDTTIKISGKAFIGFYTGVREYKVVRLTENELFLRYEDASDAALAWYIRLVPDDFPVDNGGGGLNEPSTAATNPTASSSDVISMFSDVYTNVTVDSWRTDWSAATLKEIDISGNNIKKYSDLNFVGIETVGINTIDASGMNYVNFDVWSPNTTEMKFKIVDFGADNSYAGGDDTEHEIILTTPTLDTWVNYKIPLTDFANLASTKNLAQYIFVSAPSVTSVVYIDNMYFSK